jgi:DNA polymerase III subunit epsilon
MGESKMRQIVLDTETTGLAVVEGHKIIEMGCVELIDRKLTKTTYHCYLNPEREVEAGALAIHGISNEFLKDKPLFVDIAHEFMAFVSGAELIIHNAPFDLSFINNELSLTSSGWKPITEYCRVIDTLQMARKLHAGQRNNLDALCKRYGVDHSKRDLHGALLDAYLLAQVYLAMTGGQGSFFDALNESQTMTRNGLMTSIAPFAKKHSLVVLKASPTELEEHDHYLQAMSKQGECLWLKE